MSFFKRIKNWLRKKTIIYLTKDLLTIITADELMQENPDGIYIGGKLIGSDEESQLREEAGKLLDSVLWQEVLEKPLQYDACRRMFEQGTDDKWDLYLGRVQLHVIRIQKELLKKLSKTSPEISSE